MTFFEQLRRHLALTEEDYQNLTAPVTTKDLVRLDAFADGQKLVSTMQKHMLANHTIKIYGDYDADGMIATAIMMALFGELAYHNVSYQLPVRYQDGYGIKLHHAQQFVAEGYQLIILVDNGVSAEQALAYFHAHHVDVIIIDHHAVTTLPTTMQALIHAEYQTTRPLPRCAGYLAYIVYQALLKKDNPYLLALAAIATITDAMPLIKDNRALVRIGIAHINTHQFPPLTPLVQSYPIDEETLAMAVGPVLNAIGRMIDNQDIQQIVQYLLFTNLLDIQKQSKAFIAINQARKLATLRAVESLEHNQLPVSFHMIHERSGLTGLIASRLIQYPKKIIGIFSEDNQHPSQLIGSIRADSDIPVLRWIQQYTGSLVAFGGHAQAVGLTIKKEALNSLEHYLSQCFAQQTLEKKVDDYIVLTLADLTFANLDKLNALKPFGSGFPSPMMMIKDVPATALNFSAKPPHYITTSLSPQASLFSFKVTKKDIQDGSSVDLIGKIKENRFKDVKKVQFVIDKVNEKS